MLTLPNVHDYLYLQDDEKYKDTSMDLMSVPSNRDGAVLVDIEEGKMYLGVNGETHADLLNKYFNIDYSENSTNLDIDSHVCTGIYLKDFFGQESVILYSYLSGAENVIKQSMPNVFVYEEDWEGQTNELDSLYRLAKRKRN